MAAGGRGIEVAHTALSLYKIVPVGYRVQIHEEEYRTTWGQRLMALPAGGPAGTGSLISTALTLLPWAAASWQGEGGVLSTTNRHAALFWEQVWGLPLPSGALGTLHM